MTKRRMQVFAVRRRGKDGAVWTRAGVALVEADGSINVELDVLPVDGRLHLRPAEAPGKGKIYATGKPGGYSIVLERNGAIEILREAPQSTTIAGLFALVANASIHYALPVDGEWLHASAAGANVAPDSKEGTT